MTPFWPAQRVFLTGGHGFLGAHLLPRLQATGATVSAPSHEELDLLDVARVHRALREWRPTMIVHLAARVGGIGANRENPGRFFYENAMMGVQLIESARLLGVAKFVCLGTVCAYPKFTPTPFREDDLWNGYPEETNAPYGLAKKMHLVQLQGYRAQYGFNGIYLLPANLHGPGDNFDPAHSHVIPALVRKFVEARDAGQQPVEIWGTGAASREFLYVEDCAEAIVLAAERYDGGDPVNVGTGDEITIKDLAAAIARLVGHTGGTRFNAAYPDGQPRRRLDTARAAALFGFRAHTSLEDGLVRTIEWYERTRSA
ncbi:MAG: GDP-L-fucose synthase [Gemmatimonadetes bacterium]|nr:GDP-L-fucose synthase [Gemmatimonadota bacterium]